MRYKLLGNSGLRVSELCLGTMTFGEDWGWGANQAESRAMFDAFAAAGGNFIDTANRYTEGTSERYVGECIGAERARYVLATKYTLYNQRDDVNASGNHRKNLVQSVEASLRRLGTDYVDLLYLHAWDFTTPPEEVMRALDDLVRAGKVLYLGVSDTPAWVIARCQTLAELRGWTSFISMQCEYSLLQRESERELLPMAHGLNVGVTAWAPLASGALTGKYLQGEPAGVRLAAGTSARLSAASQAIVREVVAVAAEGGHSPSQIALNWVRQQGRVVVPLIGARKVAQLQDNLGCLDFTLSSEQLQRLDTVSAISLGFPHDFLRSAGTQDVIFGGTQDKIMR